MHVESLEQQMWLVAHAFPQALKLGLIKVVLENRPVVRVSTLLDDLASPFPRRHASNICQSLFFI